MIKKKHIFIAVAIVVIGFSSILGLLYYQKILKPNVAKNGVLLIPSNTDYDELEKLVRPFLKRTSGFRWVAKKKNYSNNIKAGRYMLTKGMNNNELVNMLRSGRQKPIKLTFNNQDSFEKLAGRIAQQIEADSLSLLKVFKDEKFAIENGFDKANALSMYIPNSYEMYWNTNASQFQNKMLTEYKRFWNTDRKAKAKALNLTPAQVITIASIVHKETAHIPERKTVAGLYLNRYKNKWPLQADPTIIFAHNLRAGKDLKIKRVYLKMLEIDSPYNTYLNQGLPPGPIGMPDISAIDAVLNPASHNYYFMCASVVKPGTHVFAKTNAQHEVNSRKYQSWVAKQGY